MSGARNSPPREGWQAKPDGVVGGGEADHPAPTGHPSKGGEAHHPAPTGHPSNGGEFRDTRAYRSLPFNPKLKGRARALRKAGNLSEVLLWNQIKCGQFFGLDFDRQKIIGNYITDFYCAEKRVVVEIDGSSHDNKVDYDARRDAYLTSLGLQVIHIPDGDVKRDIGAVIEYLRQHLFPSTDEVPA
jgi:very-short-patch-repair endonuclease